MAGSGKDESGTWSNVTRSVLDAQVQIRKAVKLGDNIEDNVEGWSWRYIAIDEAMHYFPIVISAARNSNAE